MSDEVFSTTLAYTKSPKVTKRTTFQDELIKAITARSARQRSSEYSDDFDSDEIVSLGDFSDTSVDENSVKKKINDFHISDDEEKNSPKLSFLKTKKSINDVRKDEPVVSIKNDEMAPDGGKGMIVNPLSESQNKQQEVEKEKIKMETKPRILPIKSASSENNSSLEADNHFKPSPRPRSMLKKHSHREEKDRLGEDKDTALHEELEAYSTPSFLPRLNGRQPEAEKNAFSENLDPEDAWLTSLSSSSPKESLGNSSSPVSGEKSSITDQNEECTENHNSLKSIENEENSVLIDFVTTLEKPKESHVTTDDLEEEKEKAELIMNDNLTVDDPPLFQLQSILCTESAKEWLEKKNVYLHEMHRIKRIESENLRIQNEQKRAAKREEALASFEAWKVMKEKEAKKVAAKKRLEEKTKKKTEEENAVRKREALQSNSELFQSFEKWKEKKMEYLKEKSKKEKEYERAKKQKEEETVAEKRKDNVTAIEKWNEKKEAVFKEKEKEKINEKRKEELKRAEKKDKDKQALDEYEKWLEKKERKERIERKQKKHHPFLENEALPPWSPPSRTVFSKVF
ncbi:microtubule-associated protein 9 isoform X5 [Orcinus orca]|uniref:microtubule-associated protein 9 isoform X5 n=1 Tax=Orcinus orca TaxID=9733 RepID=UPI002111EBCF|nr:microtubule-associated protein 9 isoform X5 [Orcinus orca]